MDRNQTQCRTAPARRQGPRRKEAAFPQTADLKKQRTCPFVSVFPLSGPLCCVYSNKQFRIEENTLEYDSRMFPRSLQSHSAGLSRRRPSTFTATNREIPCRLDSLYPCVFFSQPVCACASALPPGAPANRCTSRSKMSSTRWRNGWLRCSRPTASSTSTGPMSLPCFRPRNCLPSLGNICSSVFLRRSGSRSIRRCCRRRSPCRARRGIRWRCSLTASCSGRGRTS